MIRRSETRSAKMTRRVMSWTRLYTAGMPETVRSQRLDEVLSDLHEHVAHGRSAGISDRTIAASIHARALRGSVSDVAWRRDVVRRLPGRNATRVRRAILAAVVAAAAIASIPLLTAADARASSETGARAEVSDLRGQLRGGAIFLVNLNAALAQDVHDVGSDPNYVGYLKQQHEGALEEYTIFSTLRSQLGREQQAAARDRAVADREHVIGIGLDLASGALLATLGLLVLAEPRGFLRREKPAPEGAGQSR